VGGTVQSAVASAESVASTALAGVESEIKDRIQEWCKNIPTYVCLQANGMWQLGYQDRTTRVPFIGSEFSDLFEVEALKDITKKVGSLLRIDLGDAIEKISELRFEKLNSIITVPGWLYLGGLIGIFFMICIGCIRIPLRKVLILVILLASLVSGFLSLGIGLLTRDWMSGIDMDTSLGIFPRFSFAVCIWLLVWVFLE
jgi:hypothetical protein